MGSPGDFLVSCVVWVKLGRMERSGITLVNELEAINVLSHVPTRGTLMVSRRILGRDWQNISVIGHLRGVSGWHGKKPLMFRVSCVGGERRISLNQPEGLFLTFQVFFVAQRIPLCSHIAIRSVLGVPCFAAHSLHFEGISYATGDWIPLRFREGWIHGLDLLFANLACRCTEHTGKFQSNGRSAIWYTEIFRLSGFLQAEKR